MTTIVVSDPKTEFSLDGRDWSPAVATWIHPSWPTLPGATWIWHAARVSKSEAINGSPVITFRRKFTAPAGIVQATMKITADNAYQFLLNNRMIGSSGVLAATSNVDEAHWQRFDVYAVTLQPGENTIVVRAVNYRSPNADASSNPGGIVFSLAVERQEAVFAPPPCEGACLAERSNVRPQGVAR